MRRLWWVLGAIVVVGVSPIILPDDDSAEPTSEPTTQVETTESVAEPTPVVTTESEPSPAPTEVTPRTTEPEPEDSPVVEINDVDGERAIDVVETLEVKGRAPKTGYSRDEFGQRWADVDRNGCDTRNDMLNRDLTDKTFKPGTRDCVVLTGTLISPFTGETISFVRGQDTSSEVQIDHVVALSDAWQKGAQRLSYEDRELFANDPLNLLAVDGSSNAQKGDGDAATWLPSNKAFRCDYVARQVGVKAKYSLWVTAAEKDAILRILNTCPDQTIPAGNDLVPTFTADVAPTPSPEPEPPAPIEADSPADVYYENCAAARAAGAAPILRGEPGYREKMDGDGDGIACE